MQKKRRTLSVVHLTKLKSGGAWEYASRLSFELTKSGQFISECYTSEDFRTQRFHFRTLLNKIINHYLRKNTNNVIHSHFGKQQKGVKSIIKQGDIIHLHAINDWLDLYQLKNLLKDKKVVWTMHSIWTLSGGCGVNKDCFNYKIGCSLCPYIKKSSVFGKFIPPHFLKRKKSFLSHVDCIIPNSRWTQNIIEDSYANSRCAQVVIYPIIADSFYVIDNHNSNGYINIGLAANSITDHNKRILEFLDFIERNYDPFFDKVIFHLAGDGKLNNPQLQIKYYGRISSLDEMNKFYNKLDLFVSPSISETFGMTLVEAQFCGVPVVAFNNGAISETMIDRVTGFLVKGNNWDDFVEGMKWSIKELICTKKEISEKIKNKFDRSTTVKNQERLYLNIINS